MTESECFAFVVVAPDAGTAPVMASTDMPTATTHVATTHVAACNFMFAGYGCSAGLRLTLCRERFRHCISNPTTLGAR